MKLFLIVLAGLVYSVSRTWNIRATSSGRYLATGLWAGLMIAVLVGGIKEIMESAAHSYLYIACFAGANALGSYLTVWVDRRWFHKDFDEKPTIAE